MYDAVVLVDRLSDLAPESEFEEMFTASVGKLEHEFLKPLKDLMEEELMRYSAWSTWG